MKILLLLWALLTVVSADASVERSVRPEKFRVPFASKFQGVCSDAQNFFFVQESRIWKVPKGTAWNENLGSMPDVKSVGIPGDLAQKGANHMGDCDGFQGFIYVPLEGTTPTKILILRSDDLAVVASPDLPATQTHAPWVTVDESDGTLLTSNFDLQSTDRVVRLSLSSDFSNLVEVGSLSLKDELGRPMHVRKLQAGEAESGSNLLWLLSDTSSDSLLGFDMATGLLREKAKIPTGLSVLKFRELEGLDSNHLGIWGGAAPGLFVMQLNQSLRGASVLLHRFNY